MELVFPIYLEERKKETLEGNRETAAADAPEKESPNASISANMEKREQGHSSSYFPQLEENATSSEESPFDVVNRKKTSDRRSFYFSG